MIDLAKLQASLKLTTKSKDIAANRKILDEALTSLEEVETAVRALAKMNQTICKHKEGSLLKQNLNWCMLCGLCLTTGH